MQNEHKSLCLYQAFDGGTFVDEYLSHSVSWFSRRSLSDELKGAFQNISVTRGIFA